VKALNTVCRYFSTQSPPLSRHVFIPGYDVLYSDVTEARSCSRNCIVASFFASSSWRHFCLARRFFNP